MCVPVRPRLSRKKLTSSSRGSTSAAYSTPLTFSLTATRLGAAIVVAIVYTLLRLLAVVHDGHDGTESVAPSRHLAVSLRLEQTSFAAQRHEFAGNGAAERLTECPTQRGIGTLRGREYTAAPG